jgi:hypothetical protein
MMLASICERSEEILSPGARKRGDPIDEREMPAVH